MPKKQKGGFILFAQEFKAEQLKKGVTFNNMAEVVSAASPHWNRLPESAKAKYKQERHKANAGEAKFTSLGQSFADVDKEKIEALKAEKDEAEETENIVKLGTMDKSILEQDFYVMDVNYFCFTNKGYVISEFTVLRFNLATGIIDNYHDMVNPGSIPTGYASDAMKECTKHGMEMPFEDKNCSNYTKILSDIIVYLRLKSKTSFLPPIFTMPNQVAPVEDFLQQMCVKAEQDDTMFRVYKLPKLFFHLVNALKSGQHEGFPKESLALDQLNALRFILIPGQGCKHHEEKNKSVHCTMSRVRCWTFTILDHCCPVAEINMVPGYHVPKEFDLVKIQDYKDEINYKPRETVAAMRDLNISMDSTSSYNISMDSTLTNNSATEQVRVHTPVRKPRIDFLHYSDINNHTAIGRGRGRGWTPGEEQIRPGQTE